MIEVIKLLVFYLSDDNLIGTISACLFGFVVGDGIYQFISSMKVIKNIIIDFMVHIIIITCTIIICINIVHVII